MERPLIPPRFSRRITKAAIRSMVQDFLAGSTHTSQSGIVLQNLIDACHAQGIAYRLRADAIEGEGPRFFIMERISEAPDGFSPVDGAAAKASQMARSGAAYEIVYVPSSGLSAVEVPKFILPEPEAGKPNGPLTPR